MSAMKESWQDVAWTPREREVIDLIGRGRTNSEIADELGISFATAKWHVSEVISKLGVSCREDVAAYWREQRGLPARWRRLRNAMAMLPVLKFGLGGTAAAGLGVGMLVAGSWVAGGGIGRAFPEQEQVPEGTPTATTTPAPTPTPFPPDSGPWYTSDQSPAGCPTASELGFQGLLCDWRNYPEVVAITGTEVCDLSGATIEDANLYLVDLRGCVLEGTTIRRGMAVYADFSDTLAYGLVLQNVGITEASFRGADLRNAVFDESGVGSADFTRANLLGATFRLSSVNDPLTTWFDTTCPDGSNSDDNGGTCSGTPGATQRSQAGPPRSVSKECLERAEQALPCTDSVGPDGGCGWDINLEPGGPCAREYFPALADAGEDCDLRGADLSGLELHFVDLRGCDLTGADLSDSKLTRGALEGAVLDDADLTGVWLSLASLEDASLRGTVLDGVLLMHSEITGADFTGSTLGKVGAFPAHYNDTLCPDGSNSDDEDGDRQTCLNNLG